MATSATVPAAQATCRRERPPASGVPLARTLMSCSQRRTRYCRRDHGGCIITFIHGYFPPKHPFKRIPKILADGSRHELVHGFGSRRSTAPFELGVYVSDAQTSPWQVRGGASRPVLAINAVAFAKTVVAAFESLKGKVERNRRLAAIVVSNAAVAL